MRAKVLVPLALAALLAPLAALPAGSVVLCFGRAPTINAAPGATTYGTGGADVIVGTAGDEAIRGLGGRDRICGLGGDDDLAGNAGKDRLDGGPGRDTLSGGPGTGNVLNGGTGDDTILAAGPSDVVRGGGGSDAIDARSTSFGILRGGAGGDTIYSGYRGDLDAGPGADHCGLGLGAAGTNCETVELLCGSGGELPVCLPICTKPNLTHAHGDFDGNGVPDTLYVWGILRQWRAQIETDGGYRARVVLPENGAEALGGYDVNGDGVDEAFIKVGSGTSTDIVGLYTLYEPVGSPATGLSCGMVAVGSYEEPLPAAPDPAEFTIGTSRVPPGTRGLVCQADGTLRELRQTLVTPDHYTQGRLDYPYLPGFGSALPLLGAPALSTVSLVSPTDHAAIDQGSRFTCGSLGLELPPDPGY